jgi:hypothetical protein
MTSRTLICVGASVTAIPYVSYACSLHIVPSVDVIGQLDKLAAPLCCYSVDALLLLASILRRLPAERVKFHDEALAGSSRRAAAKDLIRSATAAKFIYATMRSFVLDEAGRVNFVPAATTWGRTYW